MPGRRSWPTSPCRPSRTRQAISTSAGSRVKRGASVVSWPATIASARSTCASSSASLSPPNSTSSAAVAGSSSFHSCGAPTMFQAAVISAGATISSTAVAPLATSSPTGPTARSMSGKWTQATVVSGGCGTVSKTTSGM